MWLAFPLPAEDSLFFRQALGNWHGHYPPTPHRALHVTPPPAHAHLSQQGQESSTKNERTLVKSPVEGHLSCCEVMQNTRVGSDQWLDCSGSDEIPSGQQIFLPFSHSSGSYFSILDNKIHFNLHCPPSICSGWHGPSIGGGAIIFGYEKMQPRVSLFLCSATYIFVWGQPCIFLRQLQPSGKPPTCSCVTSQGSGVITQTASTERALLCRITFINHHAGSFSLTPDSMTYTPTPTPTSACLLQLIVSSPQSLFFYLSVVRTETEGENGEILGVRDVFFNLLFSCIGTGVSSAGIKNPDKVMELGADPEGSWGLEEERRETK